MQSRVLLASLALSVLTMASCNLSTDGTATPERLKPYQATVENGVFTPEALWAMGRLGEYVVSPDNSRVAYTVTRYDMEANKGWTEIFVSSLDGSEAKQITDFQAQCYNLAWQSDERIYFVCTKDGSAQLYRMQADGKGVTRLSDIETGIDGFKISPDGQRILFASTVQVLPKVADRYPDLSKSSGQIYDDLMYRHWDSWDDGTRSHLFVGTMAKDGKVNGAKDILENEPYDSPLRPFGGMEEVSWSADGKTIAYTCKKLEGREAAFSTNSDIYLYDVTTGETVNVSTPNPGYDRCPTFSPDGRYLAWLSMARGGFEADKDRIALLNLESKELEHLIPYFDYSPSALSWLPDASGFLFVAGVRGTTQIYKLQLGEEEPIAITSGMHDYHSATLAGHRLVADRVSFTKPAELYNVDLVTGDATQISHINDELLSQIRMPEVHVYWIQTSDNKQMATWVLFPPDFDSTKRHPALLFCEGGPQSALTPFWSYRWNLALMASQGYVVIAPNRRGVLTFGQEWTDQISKDHGGQEMRDLLAATDELAKEPGIDASRMGAVGASYGGYTVNWLAGNHNGRFKAFISHCGVFHSEMEFYTTEEMFFDEWEMGGKPWDKSNAVAQKSFASSPHMFVQNWNTPIMIIHGGRDYRIPYTQGMAAFNAARMLNIKSRFLFFPDESHWVLKPQNGLLWQREFYRWLDENLRADQPQAN